MPFWRCYYHVIWAAKKRAEWITPKLEAVILEIIRGKASELDSSLLPINTVADHIHIAAGIPPKQAVSEWVKQMKGVSTREVNNQFPDLEMAFGWQQSYGVLTFGAKNLKFVVDYVENQKQHHAKGTLEAYLEQMDDEG